MSTETTTETTSNTETIDGVTVKTDTTVETTATPDGKVTKKTTTTVTKTDADGNVTTETNENTEVTEGQPPRGPHGHGPRGDRALRHHHHATPEEREQWRKERKERKEKKLQELQAHVEGGEDEKQNIDEFLRLTNEYRQQNGKEALVLNDAITALAKEHNDLMLAFKRGLGHEGFYDRSKKIENSKSNAENCGFCSNKKEKSEVFRILLDQFINDPPHQKNLLGDYNQVGIAIGQNSRKQWFVTQLFAKVQ